MNNDDIIFGLIVFSVFLLPILTGCIITIIKVVKGDL